MSTINLRDQGKEDTCNSCSQHIFLWLCMEPDICYLFWKGLRLFLVTKLGQ